MRAPGRYATPCLSGARAVGTKRTWPPGSSTTDMVSSETSADFALSKGSCRSRPEGLFGSVAHASQVTGQAEAILAEEEHTPAADAQVGYSPG